MAKIKIESTSPAKAPAVVVEIQDVTDQEVLNIQAALRSFMNGGMKVSDAIAETFVKAVQMCPAANPSDLWLHVIYRGYLALPKNEQSWKRAAGFALERVLVKLYEPRLSKYGIIPVILTKPKATAVLRSLNILNGVKKTKIDIFLKGNCNEKSDVFGVIHVKSSLAERIEDDAPASQAIMQNKLLSIVLTMDAKHFPPPHGDGINYGELGGRTQDRDSTRLKRAYIERDGRFHALFSFNLRTPPSPANTTSGYKIYTLGLSEPQPDVLVNYLVNAWKTFQSTGRVS